MNTFFQSRPNHSNFIAKGILAVLAVAGIAKSYRNPGITQFGNVDAESSYAMFHHAPSKKQRNITVPDPPKKGFIIGYLTEVTYVPYGSSGKPHAPHVHKFGDYGYKEDYTLENQPLLMGDEKNNLFIPRNKSKYFIDGRGIVG